ncbi:MAG: hypothetical protein A3I77_04690 [Gammaproteobacteria bacterium RIFCSPLOWO2_02_FULL_42_14]|nr:MAG: hypothetical protein A3B71_05990 [Gammaproteobacteria bacterium RIFCSPHIGHO2_02_FULL_42_43]OGT28961.1 MAG: hypothetical protein A2624_02935 [Gammaproteobacteria bacterium RIFCSPHIGHO2_01_FULL_42_8]OGT62236.1 MAG: hypothetical protein A3I77_04690 [Gammaproteobacteria bacterium RIFCSPLOWO2_02_FULL_42_14]
MICILATLFYTYEYLLRIEPGIMLKDLRLYFSLSAGGVGLLVSAYYWAYTPLQLVVGLITDRFGARRVLLSALFFCVVGTFIFGMNENYWIAGGGRFLIGVGSAFAFVGALKLGAEWLPKKYFSFFVGLCTSLGMLGAMFGETVMSWVVDHMGWHPVIVDSLWLGVVLMGVFFFFVFEKHEITAQMRVETPLNFRLLFDYLFKMARSKTMLQVGFIGCALYLSLSVLAEQWGNTFIQKTLSVDAQSASYYVDMIFFGWFLGSPLHGILSEKLASRRHVLIFGCVLSCASIVPIIIWAAVLSKITLAVLLFLFGFFCSSEINCFAVANDLVERRLVATAMGLINACIMVSGMIVQPFFGFCLDFFSSKIHTVHSSVVYTLSDYQKALWIVPIFLIVALVFALFIDESYHQGVNLRKRDKIHL